MLKTLLSYIIVTYPYARTFGFSQILIWEIVNANDKKIFKNLYMGDHMVFLCTILKSFPLI